MDRFLIGTAGHIDHGKTALVKALTGIDADRLPEEKRRGITIDLGFAHARVGRDPRLASWTFRATNVSSATCWREREAPRPFSSSSPRTNP